MRVSLWKRALNALFSADPDVRRSSSLAYSRALGSGMPVAGMLAGRGGVIEPAGEGPRWEDGAITGAGPCGDGIAGRWQGRCACCWNLSARCAW